jgi:outer membrane immunogenic protein
MRRCAGREIKMKSFWMGAAGLIAAGTVCPALAADLPVKAPPVPVVRIYDWSGFYLGGNGSYASNQKRWDFVDPVFGGPGGSHTVTGFFGGAQAGFNVQAGALVFGAEAQGSWGEMRGWNDSALFLNQTNRTYIDALGLFTGRVGYALNNALIYVKGGAAYAHEKYDIFATDTGLTFANASENRWGSVAGGGLELAFSDNVSLAVEYDHAFLGTRNVNFAPAGIGTYAIRQDVDIVSFHLNYRWGAGLAKF